MPSPAVPQHQPLILASRSPRRRELLAEAGYVFEVVPPLSEFEPEPAPGQDPAEYVVRLAETKAQTSGCKSVAAWCWPATRSPNATDTSWESHSQPTTLARCWNCSAAANTEC